MGKNRNRSAKRRKTNESNRNESKTNESKTHGENYFLRLSTELIYSITTSMDNADCGSFSRTCKHVSSALHLGLPVSHVETDLTSKSLRRLKELSQLPTLADKVQSLVVTMDGTDDSPFKKKTFKRLRTSINGFVNCRSFALIDVPDAGFKLVNSHPSYDGGISVAISLPTDVQLSLTCHLGRIRGSTSGSKDYKIINDREISVMEKFLATFLRGISEIRKVKVDFPNQRNEDWCLEICDPILKALSGVRPAAGIQEIYLGDGQVSGQFLMDFLLGQCQSLRGLTLRNFSIKEELPSWVTLFRALADEFPALKELDLDVCTPDQDRTVYVKVSENSDQSTNTRSVLTQNTSGTITATRLVWSGPKLRDGLQQLADNDWDAQDSINVSVEAGVRAIIERVHGSLGDWRFRFSDW
ncbi:hypothetical protein BJX99DRAFT_264362 [Aspergillus californicus]